MSQPAPPMPSLRDVMLEVTEFKDFVMRTNCDQQAQQLGRFWQTSKKNVDWGWTICEDLQDVSAFYQDLVLMQSCDFAKLGLALHGSKSMKQYETCTKHARKTRLCTLWTQTSRLIFKDSAIDTGGGYASCWSYKFETGDLHTEKMKTRLLMKGSDFVISNWSRCCFGKEMSWLDVNCRILVGCFACNPSAWQTCIVISVTNPLCPSRSLLSSLPCHHHHHQRDRHHFLAYTRFWAVFPWLFLAKSAQSDFGTLPTPQLISFLAVYDMPYF